ncbi:uncharacterized protein METZ01_LOCUS2539, partial [marine metagenome]
VNRAQYTSVPPSYSGAQAPGNVHGPVRLRCNDTTTRLVDEGSILGDTRGPVRYAGKLGSQPARDWH